MDIRDQLRRDHAKALGELDAIVCERDARRAQARLARLRRQWRVLSLAQETVVRRGLGSAAPGSHATQRYREYERMEHLFANAAAAPAGTAQWHGRIDAARGRIQQYVDEMEGATFLELADRYGADDLDEMGRRFVLARDKLEMLEEAKRAA